MGWRVDVGSSSTGAAPEPRAIIKIEIGKVGLAPKRVLSDLLIFAPLQQNYLVTEQGWRCGTVCGGTGTS